MRATNRQKLSQIDRVLAAARSYRGVCQVDFLGPDTVDGLPPITRLAARIQDAEARGYRFEIIGWRNKTKVYRLADVPAPSPPIVKDLDLAHLRLKAQADAESDQLSIFETAA